MDYGDFEIVRFKKVKKAFLTTTYKISLIHSKIKFSSNFFD